MLSDFMVTVRNRPKDYVKEDLQKLVNWKKLVTFIVQIHTKSLYNGF